MGNEREEYIDRICNDMKEKMQAEAAKEMMSEKDKFIVAIDKYKNDLSDNIENLKINIQTQKLTVKILQSFLDKNTSDMAENISVGIIEDINTKNEIVENAIKAIKLMEYKVSKLDEVKTFMIENYEMMKEINFMFDNCLKFNGEYTNKIAEFDV